MPPKSQPFQEPQTRLGRAVLAIAKQGLEQPQSPIESLFAAVAIPTPMRLLDLITPTAKPIPDDGKRLSIDRGERIIQLEAWLHSFQAFQWLYRQASIQSARKSFEVIRKRRRSDPRFADDLAIFRFWSLAVYAAFAMDLIYLPAPSADERNQAIAAAKRLRRIASTTTLLSASGISDVRNFLLKLEALEGLDTAKRRKREDTHTSDRKFIEDIAKEADRLFGDVSPALIYELAALKVKNPDKTAITKMVSEYKRSRNPVP